MANKSIKEQLESKPTFNFKSQEHLALRTELITTGFVITLVVIAIIIDIIAGQ